MKNWPSMSSRNSSMVAIRVRTAAKKEKGTLLETPDMSVARLVPCRVMFECVGSLYRCLAVLFVKSVPFPHAKQQATKRSDAAAEQFVCFLFSERL